MVAIKNDFLKDDPWALKELWLQLTCLCRISRYGVAQNCCMWALTRTIKMAMPQLRKMSKLRFPDNHVHVDFTTSPMRRGDWMELSSFASEWNLVSKFIPAEERKQSCHWNYSHIQDILSRMVPQVSTSSLHGTKGGGSWGKFSSAGSLHLQFLGCNILCVLLYT